jgi:hypothetical protein
MAIGEAARVYAEQQKLGVEADNSADLEKINRD